jgi:diketogulonate reductase-like aldo/keto reductase
MEQDDRASCVASLRRGLELGLSHIDTAELYGQGYVEKEIVAEVLGGRRDQVFLVSKVLPQNASYEGTLAACERSLRRLRTDHLDLYLLHWAGPHPLERTIAAFEKLAQDGKIRFYGVSNFDEDELAAAVRHAGKGRIASNQVLYHLEERAIEHRVLPRCEREHVGICAYSPFGSGRFPSPRSAGGRVLTEIANAHHVSPYAVALRFLVRKKSVIAIPKSASPAHVEDNARAGELHLAAEEIARIDAAFPAGSPRSLPVI